MTANWLTTAQKLLGEGDISFKQEKMLVEMINRNVYHKKPNNFKLPVLFVEVCSH